MPNFRIRARGDKSAEILFYDAIGEYWDRGISAKRFAEQLNALGDVQRINVRMNSPGGDVFDAVAIYNTLYRHRARVVVDIDGMALSAATIVAMAADELRMAENASFMIHNPWSMAMGDAAELRRSAALLDDIKDTIIATYQRRATLSPAQLSTMMDEETWMKADAAKEYGFIDEVSETLAVAAHFDLSRFKNVPHELARRMRASPATPRLDMARMRIREQAKRAAAFT